MMIENAPKFVVYKGMYCMLLCGWDYSDTRCKVQTLSGTVFMVNYFLLESIGFHHTNWKDKK